jgi:Holliday junction resolvase RusA-like endonuclease
MTNLKVQCKEKLMNNEFKVVLAPPPSLNKARMAQRLGKGARIKSTPLLREWKNYAELDLLSQAPDIPIWIADQVKNIGVFKFEVLWFSDHFYKNTKPKVNDIDNRVKFLLDAVFKHVGQDDCYVFSIVLTKIQDNSSEEKCVCILSPTELMREGLTSLP